MSQIWNYVAARSCHHYKPPKCQQSPTRAQMRGTRDFPSCCPSARTHPQTKERARTKQDQPPNFDSEVQDLETEVNQNGL